jgi:hypothetical protein
VEKADGGESSQVTIATEIVARPGISGVLERLFTSAMLKRIYRKELGRLAEYLVHQRSTDEVRLGRPTSG